MNTSLPDPDGDLLLEIGTLSAEAKKLREWAETPGVSGDKDDAPVVDRRVWAAHSVSGRECIGAEVCVFGDKCFSEKAKQKAGTADIVVTNHTLLAIEIVDKHPILPDRDAIILDEGHEFADRTTQAVTEELTANMANRAAAMARRHTPGVESDKLTDACNNLADSIEDFQIMAKVSDDDSVGGRIEELPTMVFHSLTAIRESAYNYLALLASDNEATDGDLLAERARVKGAVTEVHTTAGKLLKAGEKDVMWFDPAVGALRLAPLSVSQVLRSNMLTQTPVIVTSATLTVGGGFDAIANAIGFLPKIEESSSEQIDPENFVALDVGSPFDFATQGMLYLPTSLPEPGKDGPSSELLNELADLIEAAGGRTLALFSSWRGVEAADAYLRKYLAERKDIKIITQRKGDSVGVLVDQFASDHKSILIGTISLWQGVDVPGASCSLVVIDRIPFPRPDDPVMSARAAKVDAAGGSGFMQVSVPKAALLLAQGAGRLIRSMEDKGVVAILDTRITSKRYGSVLLRSMPPFWRTNDKAIVLDSLKRLNQSFN
jgi:ATP-dependent DNA helicase DinG